MTVQHKIHTEPIIPVGSRGHTHPLYEFSFCFQCCLAANPCSARQQGKAAELLSFPWRRPRLSVQVLAQLVLAQVVAGLEGDNQWRPDLPVSLCLLSSWKLKMKQIPLEVRKPNEGTVQTPLLYLWANALVINCGFVKDAYEQVFRAGCSCFSK